MGKVHLYYGTDEPILVGDVVKIARKFRKDILGTVTYVHEPGKPETLARDMQGLNDEVIEVAPNGNRWITVGSPFKGVSLVRRGT